MNADNSALAAPIASAPTAIASNATVFNGSAAAVLGPEGSAKGDAAAVPVLTASQTQAYKAESECSLPSITFVSECGPKAASVMKGSRTKCRRRLRNSSFDHGILAQAYSTTNLQETNIMSHRFNVFTNDQVIRVTSKQQSEAEIQCTASPMHFRQQISPIYAGRCIYHREDQEESIATRLRKLTQMTKNFITSQSRRSHPHRIEKNVSKNTSTYDNTATVLESSSLVPGGKRLLSSMPQLEHYLSRKRRQMHLRRKIESETLASASGSSSTSSSSSSSSSTSTSTSSTSSSSSSAISNVPIRALNLANNKRYSHIAHPFLGRNSGLRNEMELIKSASRIHPWTWNDEDKSHEAIVSKDKLEVCFHPHCSESAAAIRGSVPLVRNGNYYYWEVTVFDKTYGTSVMFGLCTKDQPLHVNDYCNLVGLDQNGWSLSHKGLIWHGGRHAQYSDVFPANQTVTIGILFNSMRGEISYFMDGKNLGVAFQGLNDVKGDLYPVVGSTAKCTRMRLQGAYCGYVSLLERSCFAVLKSARDKVELVRQMHHTYHIPRHLIDYIADAAQVCDSQT